MIHNGGLFIVVIINKYFNKIYRSFFEFKISVDFKSISFTSESCFWRQRHSIHGTSVLSNIHQLALQSSLLIQKTKELILVQSIKIVVINKTHFFFIRSNQII